MIIIAAKAFQTQAERLAEEHRATDGLTVEVVDPQSIYNEFSSGAPDATAYRRFMKCSTIVACLPVTLQNTCYCLAMVFTTTGEFART